MEEHCQILTVQCHLWNTFTHWTIEYVFFLQTFSFSSALNLMYSVPQEIKFIDSFCFFFLTFCIKSVKNFHRFILLNIFCFIPPSTALVKDLIISYQNHWSNPIDLPAIRLASVPRFNQIIAWVNLLTQNIWWPPLCLQDKSLKMLSMVHEPSKSSPSFHFWPLVPLLSLILVFCFYLTFFCILLFVPLKIFCAKNYT